MKKHWDKIFKTLGSISVLVAPTVAIISCDSEKKEKSNEITAEQITLGYNLLTIGKFVETNGAFIKDATDSDWPLPIKRFKEGTSDEVEPRYNLVKILDAGLTKKSLNDTWPSELKWWATSFAYALSVGFYNQNKIGPDADWDGEKGQRLGQVAKALINSVFSDAKEKKEFQIWADKFIEHRKQVKAGASAYSKVEKNLAGELVNKFREKAIKFSVGLIKVWQVRWNWDWTTYDAAKLLRFVNYNLVKAEVKKWVNEHGSEVRIPHETSVVGYSDQKALNASNTSHTFNAGWYNKGLSKNQDGSQVSAPVRGLSVSRVVNNGIDSNIKEFTIQEGAFSGSQGVNNNNWKKVSSGSVKMVYLGKDEPNGGQIFVREDAINSDATLTRSSLAEKIEQVKNGGKFDKYGKTVIWVDNLQNIKKFWTIADFKMYFKFPRTVAAKWTSNDGTERRYRTASDFDQLTNYATKKLKSLIM